MEKGGYFVLLLQGYPNRIYICLSRLISLIRFRRHLLLREHSESPRSSSGPTIMLENLFLVYHRSNLPLDRDRSGTNHHHLRPLVSHPLFVFFTRFSFAQKLATTRKRCAKKYIDAHLFYFRFIKDQRESIPWQKLPK